MQGYRRRIGLMIAMAGMLLLTPLAVWAQQSKSGGTLRVAWESDLTGLDPHISTGIQAYRVVGNLFNSLVTLDAEMNYVPDLAESWELQENGKVYVFHLRKGVKFHDGTDFDAEVVLWNYKRITNPEVKTLDAPFYSIVDTVEAIDAHTVKFTLKHPSATLLPVMAAYRVGFAQMSPASYERWGKEECATPSSGNGAVHARPLGPEPDHRVRKEPALLQARAALPGPHRAPHHEGGGDPRRGLAGRRGRFRKLHPYRTCRASDQRSANPGHPGSRYAAYSMFLQPSQTGLPGCARATGPPGVWHRSPGPRQNSPSGPCPAVMDLRGAGLEGAHRLRGPVPL